MREFHITFTINDEGLSIVSRNEGFTGLELIGLLDLKRDDLIKQIADPTQFTRTAVYDYGKKDIIEDKEK